MKPSPILLLCVFTLVSLPVSAEPQSFEQALAKAYTGNRTLQAGRAKLRAVEEQIDVARSGYRPSVEASAGIGKSYQDIESGGSFAGSGTLSPRDAGVTVSQPVFRGFRTVAGVESAQAQAKAQQALLQGMEQQILLASAKAYLDVVEAQSVVGLTRHNEDVLSRQLESTKMRFDSGEVTKTDISQAQARLSVAQAQRIQAEGELSNNEATYFRLIGNAPEGITQPVLTLDQPRTLEEAVQAAQAANPGVIAATYAQDAAKADITSARGALMPEVSVQASASRSWDQSLMTPNRQDAGTMMARVTVPLYRAGADYAKTRAAQETAVQKRMELEDSRAQARELSITAWQSLTTARAAIKAHEAAIKATDLAVQGVRVESEVGSRTTLDVLDAEQELLAAKVNLVRAQHDEALAILTLKAALGVLTGKGLGLEK